MLIGVLNHVEIGMGERIAQGCSIDDVLSRRRGFEKGESGERRGCFSLNGTQWQ